MGFNRGFDQKAVRFRAGFGRSRPFFEAERILQMGNLEEWRNMVSFYTKEQILETIEWNAQLDGRDKEFSRFFLTSDFLNAT